MQMDVVKGRYGIIDTIACVSGGHQRAISTALDSWWTFLERGCKDDGAASREVSKLSPRPLKDQGTMQSARTRVSARVEVLAAAIVQKARWRGRKLQYERQIRATSSPVAVTMSNQQSASPSLSN